MSSLRNITKHAGMCPLSRRRRIGMAIGFSVFLSGMLLFPGWFLVSLLVGAKRSTLELPLGHVKDVVADSAGNIYVADGIHFRVQRYSPTGEFERGWFVPGVHALRVIEGDRLKVATKSAYRVQTYSPSGELLGDAPHPDMYGEFIPWHDGRFRVQGDLMPRIVDAQCGRAIVYTRWTKRLLAAPFPSAAYAALGLIIAFAAERFRWKNEGMLSPAAGR